MYKLLCFLTGAAFIVSTTTAQQQKVSVTGKVPSELNGEKIFFIKTGGKREPTLKDSVIIANGKFTMSLPIEEPSLMQLYMLYRPGDANRNQVIAGYREVFLSPGDKIAFEATKKGIADRFNIFEGSTVKGSKLCTQWDGYTKSFKSEKMALDSLNRIHVAIKDRTEKIAFYDKVKAQEQVLEQLTTDYIDENPSTYVSLYLLNKQLKPRPKNPQEAQERFDKLAKNIKATPLGESTQKLITASSKLDVGQEAPDFAGRTPDSTLFRLSSLRGKYVLLDFWASWCGPCRADNPNVVKLYNKYKDKGLDVLGVSLDRPGQKNSWIEAIEKDGLTWHHVSELKWWDGDISRMYLVAAIPQNFLIDPSGKIIAVNLRGAELEAELAKIFK